MIQRLLCLLPIIRYITHVLVYYRFKDRALLDYERDLWINNCNTGYPGVRGFVKLLHTEPAYRTLFYFRTNAYWLSFFAKRLNDFYICMKSEQIGRGLMIWHGYSTILNCQRIGENFQVWHNVTLGKKSTQSVIDKPIVGDNVSVCTGAVCIGDIKIGDNAIIGANATVVKDVPENAVVVNQPSRVIIKRAE